MTPQELKNSILQLAIEGKLVKQRPEEGTAEELYREIQAEKQRLIKEGKIKKEKPLPEIAEDEKPFEIPESWMWVRLGNLLQVISGVSYKKDDVAENGLRILRGGNIQDGEVLLDEEDVFLPESYDDPEKRVQKGDIIIVASTGSKAVIGKAGYVDRNIPNALIGAFLRICRPYTQSIESFLRYIFASSYYRKHIRDLSQGTNINNIKESYITEFLIPLPPLAEQKRIVAKIEELLPYVDRYAEAWNRLEELNKHFPPDMKNSLLQMAVEGKLVEQRPDEGTAEELYREIQAEKQRLIKEGKIKKEKPLPQITEDEKPFEIPESWMWVRLGNLLRVISGVSYKKDDVVENGLRILRGGNIQDGEVLLDEEDVFLPESYDDSEKRVQKGDIIIVASTGSKAVIVRICRLYTQNIESFLRYIFASSYYRKHIRDLSQGTNINNIKESYITEFLIPLPPLAEQKRIVAKLDELLAVCERLK